MPPAGGRRRLALRSVHLKTLALKGFKSFAEPSSIHLEPGVTAVVGPNGSGKSNVVDAVAWVLGAQAPSSVRSARMEDVIFAGTDRKQALGRAEVSLTIDNSDGALPVALSEVRITRTLFRGGESSYQMNGSPCRLLDIVELLSDTGVGRLQHTIVSQSQIDSVLNARPEERREVIEEAAGTLKYRKRRERAERRLAATDGDLVRIGDLVREVRRQLRPLQRQAEAARRHAGLVDELRTLRIELAAQEIDGLRGQLREHRERAEARAEMQGALRRELQELNGSAARSEQRLAGHGVQDWSEQLARTEGLRARAGGLAAVVGERLRSIERERAALVDNDLVASLSAEVEHCRQEIDAVSASQAEQVQAGRSLEALRVALEADRSDFRARWGAWDEESSLPGLRAAEAAEARGERAALASAVDSYESELARLGERLDAASARLASLQQSADLRRRELGRFRSEAQPLRAAVAAARSAQAVASGRHEAAAERLAGIEADLRHWTSRREALCMAAEARDPPVPDAAGAPGVLGALSSLVEIKRGSEAAFAAAVEDAASAVVVRDAAAARRLLASLEASDAATAVIVLEGVAPAESDTLLPLDAMPRSQLEGVAPAEDDAPRHGSGAATGGPTRPGDRSRSAGDAGSTTSGAATTGSTPLRGRVRSPDPDVERLLDSLLAGVVVVDAGWRDAVGLAVSDPGLVIVTVAGDRFSRRGWRLGVPAAAGVRAALIEADERACAAEAARDGAAAELEQARGALSEHQAHLEALGERLAGAERGADTAAEALERAEADRRDLDMASGAVRDHLAETAQRLERSRRRLGEIDARLPELEAAEASDRARAQQAAQARAEIDRRSADLTARASAQSMRDTGLAQHRELLERRLAEVAGRLARHEAASAATEDRLAGLERRRVILEGLSDALAARTVVLDAALERLRTLRRRHSEQARLLVAQLDDLRRRCAATEARLEELRAAASVDDVEEARLRTLLQGVVERLRDDHGLSPSQARRQEATQLPEGLDAAARVDQLCAELELMGPVNPLALAEFDELTERHDLLRGQLEDVRAARRDLNRVIRSINGEIRSVLSAALVDVASNFELLFEALFPGGEGRLTLTDPEDLLNTGIEVSAKPSGKNVKRLSLLSGGERTLAALAFLFAVFRSRPSPFYLLDEVEAALDDVNLNRFLKLVDEFRADAQLLIVTHQKRTMEAADCLHGVSMKPGGSSVVVSERVSEAA